MLLTDLSNRMRACRPLAATLASSVSLTAIWAGCNKSPYDLVPVHGKVTFNGQPLTSAKVMFAPIAKGKSGRSGKPAFGVLQPDGSFVLGTYKPDDGAVVGKHWVTVFKMGDSSKKNRGLDQHRPPNELAPTWARVVFPDPQSVTASQDNDININLTSDIVKRHGELED